MTHSQDQTVGCILFLFIYFWPGHIARRILTPDQGSNLCALHRKAQCLNHPMAREVPEVYFKKENKVQHIKRV